MPRFQPKPAANSQPPAADPDWRNLRDDQGRLYGRIHRERLILEVRSHGKTVVFDLQSEIKVLK